MLAPGTIAQIAPDRGAQDEALWIGLEYVELARSLGSTFGIAGSLGTVAGAVLAQNQPEQATRLLASGRAISDTIGAIPVAHNLYVERVLATA